MPDDDGYPTQEELGRIRQWTLGAGLRPWLEFVKSCWWAADWGWHEFQGVDDLPPHRPVRVYHVSTGGWSGNESIIGAMKENTDYLYTFIAFAWRRGGHYEWRIPNEWYDREAKPSA